MNNNSLIACGGTGAHVMLAMVRLHILGSPFGFFISKDRNFPDLFLVDQDNDPNADNDEGFTAWGKVIKLMKEHPGRYNPQEKFGLQRRPNLERITPLPIGSDGKWHKPPNNALEYRFHGSQVTELITSEHQRKIEYDRGMMASPALGSLLLSFKEHDTNDGGTNNEKTYDELIRNFRGNVVVCGSSVGGTGASVVPTLARCLGEQDAKIMAVLIHKWFRFDTNDKSQKNLKKAKKCNEEMDENAAGGLAYSGEKLASDVATVLVGVPNSGLISRIYSGPNKQACKDSYIHAVGALAGMQHLLSNEEEIAEGLYGMSAYDDKKLTGEIKIGEGRHSTLNDLVGQAECLVHVLTLYCDDLAKYEHRAKLLRKWTNKVNIGFFDTLRQEICGWVYNAVDKNLNKVKKVAHRLESVKKDYDALLEWLRGLEVGYDLSKEDKASLETKYNLLKQIKGKRLSPLDGAPDIRLKERTGIDVSKEEYVTLVLFHWIAGWIKDWWRNEKTPSADRVAVKGYWPPVVVKDPKGTPPWGQVPAGRLGKVKPTDVTRTLGDYFLLEDISPNGWPHPVAVVDEFTFRIEQKDSIAIRKLELLLLGRALKLLNLEKLRPEEDGDSREFELIKELIKKEYPKGLAQYRLVHNETKKIYGFNSPETLLCPIPDIDGQDWHKLWCEINRHTVVKGSWQTSQEWGYDAKKARGCIAAWIKGLEGKIQENNCWKSLIKRFNSEEGDAGAFGIAEWLPIADDQNGEKVIPLPVFGDSVNSERSENEEVYDANDEEIRKHIRGFDEFGGFKFIKDLPIPGLKHNNQSMIWRNHLNKLQEKGEIFAWGRNKENDRIWIMKNFQEQENLIHIKNLRVIDLDTILIKTCIPLIQRPVPGSNVKKDDLKFPDLPIHPDYVSLVKSSSDEGGTLVDSNWMGMSEESYKVDEGEQSVRWKLDMLGYPEPVKTPPIFYTEPVEAHWMIWPNFKSEKSEREHQWKAYYIYEHSARESLEARPILDKGGNLSEPKERPKGSLGPSRAVEFDAKQGIHTGGPPVALCAYDHEKSQNLGVYKIELLEVHKPEIDSCKWRFAMDFGTTHTVAAVSEEIRGDKKSVESVVLSPELVDGYTRRNRSLHVSENWPEDMSEKSRMRLDLWRPTYVTEDERSDSELPSDIWSFQNLDPSLGKSKKRRDWKPMDDYVIPHKKLNRKDSHNHVISGFKWKVRQTAFEGQEPWLQKRYLGMAIEIFLANAALDKQRLPREIEFTFTYPLRGTSRKDTERYVAVVNNVLEHSKRDLGFKVTKNKGKLYSESHAATDRIGTGNPFEVKLLADLGGGTLDVFISTSDIGDDEKKNRFEKVADSTELGVDLLLQIMAERSGDYLPQERLNGWGDDAKTCFENLRTWMRFEGSNRLFGKHPKSTKSDLDLWSFGSDKGDRDRAEAARELIDRYLRLNVHFLARTLVAYVAKNIWRNERIKTHEREEAKLFVQLQGNGWRLWYDTAKYDDIQTKIWKDIRNCANQLWAKADVDVEFRYAEIWHEDKVSTDPKLGPIRNAVGKGHDPFNIDDIHRFPLSKVLLRRQEKDIDSRKWFESLPFTVEYPDDISLKIRELDPPLSLCDDSPSIILNGDSLTDINNDLEEQKRPYRKTIDAPVAAIIWEAIFNSEQFRKN